MPGLRNGACRCGHAVSRSVEERISDIIRAVKRCQRYSDALDSDDPNLVNMAQDAIERNLQIIGEAANHLPSHVTHVHPQIAWPQIRGFRNILVHQYFGVDVDTIRDVVSSDLPKLAAELHADGNAAESHANRQDDI